MAKIMVFIDGTWLYGTRGTLGRRYGKASYQLDYGRLPRELGRRVGEQLGMGDVDVVRTYFFASIPANYDPADAEAVMRQQEFYDTLKEVFHYEVELFDIDFGLRRLRREDRSDSDAFAPKEKCVDIALAAMMLYFAAIPQAYDVAIAVLGDRDYVPVLQHVRRLGKRVAIASVKGHCARLLNDPQDTARVRDADVLWLDDILKELEWKCETQRLRCESPLHEGDRYVYVAERARPGRTYYCPACRGRYAREQAEAVEVEKADMERAAAEYSCPDGFILGRVNRIIEKDEHQYGFIQVRDGREFYFCPRALSGVSWGEMSEGLAVVFQVMREPHGGKAGAATKVQPAKRSETQAEREN
jgi:uncharacterized LabA/DUF88 family protein/cold shock CspA family protein